LPPTAELHRVTKTRDQPLRANAENTCHRLGKGTQSFRCDTKLSRLLYRADHE
jgi:hypothetical protein